MASRWPRLLAFLVCLFLCLQLTDARRSDLVRRQQDASPERTQALTTEAPAVEPTGAATGDPEEDEKPTRTTTSSRSATTSVETSVPTMIDDDSVDQGDDDVFAPIPEGELPLPPRITPAYGLAGVLLLISGLVLATIGIKNKWLQTFLSVTFLGNLATTVLIIYVMSVPVSDAIQGAYLVAVVLTGVILGAGATIFKELTEGLGCILGGFCVAMWILTLVPGGLLPQVIPKVAFIAALSVGSFGLYLSHYTRDYSHIFLLAFSGATFAVLGLDCFSRAGLKEFWAYVWSLNDDLFPFNAETYPVTKGIRVEAAAIAAEKAEDERNLQAEEEEIGRQVEAATARDRRAWERVYGDGDGQTVGSSRSSSRELENEKEMHVTTTTAAVPISSSSSEIAAGEGETPKSHPSAVRDAEEMAWAPSTGAQVATPPVRDSSVRASRAMMMTPQPDVVPLPFQVTEEEAAAENEADRHTAGDARSSIAGTFADEDDGSRSKRGSLARRLSQRSTNLLHGLSHRAERTLSGRVATARASQEELVVKRVSVARTEDEDDGSVAATVDDESVDDERSTVRGEVGEDIEINAELAHKRAEESAVEDGKTKDDAPGENEHQESPEAAAAKSNGEETPELVPEEANAAALVLDEAAAASTAPSKKGPSISSKTSSQPAALTKDALPDPLSRTALKYRTNEVYPAEETAKAESAAPVNVEELQQTAENGAPKPAQIIRPAAAASVVPAAATSAQTYGRSISRSESRLSTHGVYDQQHGLLRQASSSVQPTMPADAPLRSVTSTPGPVSPEDLPTRTASRNSITPAAAIVPYTNVGTLMGQRETYIRAKAYGPYPTTATGPVVDYSVPLDVVPNDAGSVRHFSPHPSRAMTPDEDDMPLSQRRAIIRQSSLLGLAGAAGAGAAPANHRSSSANYYYGGASMSTENIAFNSHQPQRTSTVPGPAAREAALASFRHVLGGLFASASSATLVGGREAEVQRTMEIQRSLMLREKEAEAQAREAERWEKEMNERAFEQMMRSGNLLDAHREAMRRLQGTARDK
ncbi:unnamed protein product [Parascedosporium putredinis]|uniref:TM7S3/TM198-like domain-containing protein n=1 Tax=Parascedosporium putredinis TaxID=1442378 RepID=A0A9P1GW91_9PEZI|nr:unnamed protein product [Parascedosporium putredinis]CAI7988625.1 unnamed protein product [Parascedosporium putredinis]